MTKILFAFKSYLFCTKAFILAIIFKIQSKLFFKFQNILQNLNACVGHDTARMIFDHWHIGISGT